VVASVLCAVAGGTAIASGAKDDRATSLEREVVAPFKAQLEQLNQQDKEHARAVDSGATNLVRPDPELNPHRRVEKPPGWVILVVRPFEDNYYSSSYTEYGDPTWQWTMQGEEASVRYDETLYTKTADSVEELAKLEWIKTISRPRELRAKFHDGGWQVEEVSRSHPAEGQSVHRFRESDGATTTPAGP